MVRIIPLPGIFFTITSARRKPTTVFKMVVANANKKVLPIERKKTGS